MKRLLSFLLLIALFCTISGCSIERCDLCDDFGAEHEVSYLNLCDDCYNDYGNDYGYSYGYDYDYDYSYDYGSGRCRDCGTSVPSNRIYCDRCLGYGTCQDCGKSIASDRLYCNSCLYN